MKWIPKSPVKSHITPRLKAQDYLSDLAIDFEKRDLMFKSGDIATVSGIDNFRQKLIKFTLTPKTALHAYGFEHNIFGAQNQVEFDAEAESLAQQIVSQVLSDSTPNSPNGLGHTVESVLIMEETSKNNRKYLDITVTVTGLPDPITVSIPNI